MKFGALVVAGSGKIGGHVASKNRGGAYLRTKTTPSNPNTSYQAGARSLLASLASQWRELTEAQRLAWNGAVAQFATTDIFGDIKNPSGINLFVKLNANLANSGQAQLTSPPEKIEVPTGALTGAEFVIADSTLTIASENGLTTDNICRLQSSGPVSQGVTNVKSKMRTIMSSEALDDSLANYAAYVAKFGAPVVGQKIFLSVAPITATGQVGVAQTIIATVVAS